MNKKRRKIKRTELTTTSSLWLKFPYWTAISEKYHCLRESIPFTQIKIRSNMFNEHIDSTAVCFNLDYVFGGWNDLYIWPRRS